MPFFSIVIPVFNKEKFIANTIKSVLQQRFVDYELIIVNDGSTDQSESKILSFDDKRIKYFSKNNEGASIARNFGIEQAKSNFITFLDADDYWYPDFLEEMYASIHEFPEQSVFSGAIEIENRKNIIPAVYSIPKQKPRMVVNYFEGSDMESVLCTSCAVFHKNVFEKVGQFDPVLRSGQDTDLWIRIGLHFPIVFSFKILARYVYDKQSLSRDKSYSGQKLDFSKFVEEEKHNEKLKKFLDLNRYSFALKCRLDNDYENYSRFKKDINPQSLSLRKKILLETPAFLLRILLKVNLILVQVGITKTVFKE